MPDARPRELIAFDLDDTLYKERDYLLSGVNAVCKLVSDLFGACLNANHLFNIAMSGGDWISALIMQSKLSPTIKETLLWTYRIHTPQIRLDELASHTLVELSARYEIVVITDGRVITQRLKMKSLGLEKLPIYISDECGATKPSPKGFQLAMEERRACGFIYVADNIEKDFLAPKSLGWTTIGLRNDGRNIRKHQVDGFHADCHPDFWIDCITEIFEILESNKK